MSKKMAKKMMIITNGHTDDNVEVLLPSSSWKLDRVPHLRIPPVWPGASHFTLFLPQFGTFGLCLNLNVATIYLFKDIQSSHSRHDQECAGGENHAKECSAFAKAGIRVNIGGSSSSWDKPVREYQVSKLISRVKATLDQYLCWTVCPPICHICW